MSDYKQKAIVLLVLGVACLVYFRTRIYNGLGGPVDVEVRDLSIMEQVPARNYVRVVRDGRPVEYAQLAQAGFYEAEVRDSGERPTAGFRWLEAGKRRMLVRVTESSDRELIGVLTPIKGGQMSVEAPGEVLYVDCENTHYRLVSSLLLGLGLMAIGLGIDQLRRAYRKA